MKKKFAFLAVALAMVLLLGGAYLLYDRLSGEVDGGQLALQSSSAPESSEPESSEASAPESSDPSSGEASEAAYPDAPNFLVYDADGNMVYLSDYAGKPVVLNFWASWCGPCQAEMPDFEAKYQELGGEVQFLMINATDGARETVETASAFIAEQGYTFPVFYDTDNSASYLYGAYSLPTTFFIDAEGRAIARAVGTLSAEYLQQGIDLIAGGEK